MKKLTDIIKNEYFIIVLAMILFSIAVCIIGSLTKSYVNERINDKLVESLKETVNTVETESETVTAEVGVIVEAEQNTTEEAASEWGDELSALESDVPQKNLDWDYIKSLNPDIYAWICVPGTDVDYPVFQHPDDNQYYLRHNLDGTMGHPGCLYTENYNSKDFSDCNTVIYGHTLVEKDMETMFTTLHNFEDESFFNEDHFIYVYTENEVLVYRVFAAYEYLNMHLLLNFDYTKEGVFGEYLDRIYNNSFGRIAYVKEDFVVTEEDKIITLSTCPTDFNFDLRYLIAGVLVNSDPEISN